MRPPPGGGGHEAVVRIGGSWIAAMAQGWPRGSRERWAGVGSASGDGMTGGRDGDGFSHRGVTGRRLRRGCGGHAERGTDDEDVDRYARHRPDRRRRRGAPRHRLHAVLHRIFLQGVEDGTPGPEDCGVPFLSVGADAAGEFDATYTVRRFMTPSSVGATIDCASRRRTAASVPLTSSRRLPALRLLRWRSSLRPRER